MFDEVGDVFKRSHQSLIQFGNGIFSDFVFLWRPSLYLSTCSFPGWQSSIENANWLVSKSLQSPPDSWCRKHSLRIIEANLILLVSKSESNWVYATSNAKISYLSSSYGRTWGWSNVPMACAKASGVGSIWGYGLDKSQMASRSKNRAPGMWCFWNSSKGFRGSSGINQVQSRTIGPVRNSIPFFNCCAVLTGSLKVSSSRTLTFSVRRFFFAYSLHWGRRQSHPRRSSSKRAGCARLLRNGRASMSRRDLKKKLPPEICLSSHKIYR